MEKVSITRRKLMDVWTVLEGLGEKTLHIKAMYAIVKNRKTLNTEIEAIRDAARPPQGFIAYEKERIALCESFCSRNEKGEPVIENKAFVFPLDKLSDFHEELKRLQEKHVKDIEDANKLDVQMGQLLEDAVDIDVYTIPANVLEDGGLTLAQFELLVDVGIITEPVE
jgi:hypothetical protein